MFAAIATLLLSVNSLSPMIAQNPSVLDSTPMKPTTNFQARGNEPGWHLEISDRQLKLQADYGEVQINAPLAETQQTGELTRYVADFPNHTLTVTVSDRLCADTMTGMPHPQTVVVLLDGRELQGCGGQPLALLQGAEWLVEDINGKGIIDHSRLTLNFLEENRLAGMSSCNSYVTTYSLTGEGLTISQAAATLKACAPALMNQEQLFLGTLKNIQRFEISADGALILYTNDQRTITARGLTQ